MLIVIDIPEEVFNEIVSTDNTSHLSRAFLKGSYLYFKEALQNGTPLPKGHGRLIDADALPLHDIDDANHGSNYIRIAPTIIEADIER